MVAAAGLDRSLSGHGGRCSRDGLPRPLASRAREDGCEPRPRSASPLKADRALRHRRGWPLGVQRGLAGPVEPRGLRPPDLARRRRDRSAERGRLVTWAPPRIALQMIGQRKLAQLTNEPGQQEAIGIGDASNKIFPTPFYFVADLKIYADAVLVDPGCALSIASTGQVFATFATAPGPGAV